MTTAERAQAIERGMKLLDEKVPDWKSKIDLTTLDLGSHANGLLEQVFGSYVKGLQALNLTWATAADYGFDLPEERDIEGVGWPKLTDAWIQAIAKEVTPQTK